MKRFSILRSLESCPVPAASAGAERSMQRPLYQLRDSPERLFLDVQELSRSDAQDLARDPAVLAYAPEMPIKLLPPSPAAAEPTSSWGIDAVAADRSPYTGEGVVVAVLDTGIDATHPAFSGVELIQRSFVGTEEGDPSGHGTHCAGTLFGRDVAGTRIGVARGIRKALIGKVLDRNGDGQASAIYSALYWAFESGANVISMSLGFDYTALVAGLVAQGCPAERATSIALEAYRSNIVMFDALMGVFRASIPITGGAIVVAAAGDESRRYMEPRYEVGVSMPAAAQDVISVGSVERSAGGLRASGFSNASPLVSAPGSGIVSARSGGGLATKSGTSMAAPHAAGIAALWWEATQRARLTTNARTVVSRMLAAAHQDGFAAGTMASDRGVGLVTAPLAPQRSSVTAPPRPTRPLAAPLYAPVAETEVHSSQAKEWVPPEEREVVMTQKREQPFVPCTLRQLPDEQWLAAALNAQRVNPENVPEGTILDASISPKERAVIDIDRYWGKGGVRLTVAFLDNPLPELRARILSHMNAWGRTANVVFMETASISEAQVRISRNLIGHWSFLGTDILLIPPGEPTMNLQQFTMNTPESEFFRVVRHEAGHTLGFPHEHMRKEIIARLDREKTFAYFKRTQGWSQREVIEQVLKPLDPARHLGTPADETSIMCYDLPAEITLDGEPIPGGDDINQQDARFAGQMYPKP
jgi:hypothetical protein